MKPGRELNTKIATEVFGYKVWKHKGDWTENHPLGDRPLRNYSNSIEWAWEVAEKMRVMLIPTSDQQWFAFVGPENQTGWPSPQAAVQFLEAGQFDGTGAEVNVNPALAICLAALNAIQKRKAQSATTETQPVSDEIISVEAEVVPMNTEVMH